MELREYWTIWWRRAWLPLLLAVLTAGFSLATASRPQPVYAAVLQVAAGVRLQPPTGSLFTYEGYYGATASEYLADDFAEIIKSPAFAQDVRAELANPSLADGVAWQADRLKKAHRLIVVSATAPTAETAAALGEAAARAFEQRAGKYLAALGHPDGAVAVVDPPRVENRTGARGYLEIVLRMLLGLVAGSGLVFFLAYLDTALRTPEDVDRALGLPVLGEIPSRRS